MHFRVSKAVSLELSLSCCRTRRGPGGFEARVAEALLHKHKAGLCGEPAQGT